MKKAVTMIVAAVALAAVVASPAMAYRGMRAGYGSGPGNVADMGAGLGLDLTTEQTQKINDMREAHLKEIKPLQDQLYAKNGDLRNLWLAETPDKEKILALQKEVRNLRDQLTDKMTAYRLEARKVLTPEQLTKVQSYGMGQGMARGGAGMSHMGSGPSMMVGGHTPGWGIR
jgi:Spy/CpxP family protein refolding chaperone